MTNQFILTIKMDNDAFGADRFTAGAEVSRILSQVAARLAERGADPADEQVLRDANGNAVGSWIVDTV